MWSSRENETIPKEQVPGVKPGTGKALNFRTEEGAGKVDFRPEAFPLRLKPDSFCITYGAAEAAPFQNRSFFASSEARMYLRDNYKGELLRFFALLRMTSAVARSG